MVTGCYIQDVYVVDITSDKASSAADVKLGSQWADSYNYLQNGGFHLPS
jgi:hypothetical protein